MCIRAHRSLLVSLFWNMLLQKTFVYRNVSFDKTLNRMTHRQPLS